MDFLFYIIIIGLILLKIFIWVCVIRARRERREAALRSRGIMIVAHPDARRMQATTRDISQLCPSGGMYGYPGQGGVDNPQMFPSAPPSYDDVVQNKATETKPPSYDQVLQLQTGQPPIQQHTTATAQQ